MDANSQTALITGASGGIGYELAKLFAGDHCNLVLVARSGDKLKAIASELQSEFQVSVKTVALDLAAEHGAKILFDHLQGEAVVVDVLVNPLSLNGGSAVTAVRCIVFVPVLLTVTVCVDVLPSAVAGKFTTFGLTPTTAPVVVPVPESVTIWGALTP